MENKKYELVKEDSIVVEGRTLYRIRALKDFYIVKAGELGGYIQEERNLSQEDTCWVFDNAKVHGTAMVTYIGVVRDNAEVDDGCKITKGCVSENAKVTNYSTVKGGVVSGNAIINNSKVSNCASISGDANLYKTVATGYCKIDSNAVLRGSYIDGQSVIGENNYTGKNVHLTDVKLLPGVKVTHQAFIRRVTLGFDVDYMTQLSYYTDPVHPYWNIVASRSENKFTTGNANGTAADIIAAQRNEEEMRMMSILLQAHLDIYNIQ